MGRFYGASGRITQQLDALGRATAFSWDEVTETATVTDARGNAWVDVYDGNVLQRRIDPLGNEISYQYDDDLNVTRMTDARGNNWNMTYDARGNMLSRTAPAPLSSLETFTYDADNHLTSYTDARNNTTTYAYDAQGNLTSITQPGVGYQNSLPPTPTTSTASRR